MADASQPSLRRTVRFQLPPGEGTSSPFNVAGDSARMLGIWIYSAFGTNTLLGTF